MKKYIPFYFVALIVIGSVILFLMTGLQPKSVMKIKWSEFEDVPTIAHALQVSLQKDYQEKNLFIFGLDPGVSSHLNAILEFQKVLPDNLKYQDIWVQEGLLELPVEGAQIADFRHENLPAWSQIFDSPRRTLVLLPNAFSSTVVKESPVSFFKKTKEFVSLSFVNYPRNPEEENQMVLPCTAGAADQTGTSDLGCRILQTARFRARKGFSKKNQLFGQLELVGNRDYLFLLK
jgi:hypothetical protein